MSLADMGILFQFFLPNTLTAQDLTEDQAATGAIALFVNEDATNSMSIGYGMAVDAEGNTVTTLEELNAAYASAGCEDMEYATINGIPCMSYSIKASDVGGVAFLFDDGTQLTFNFSPASDENFAVATYAILSSIMPVEEQPKRRLNFWGFGHSKRFRLAMLLSFRKKRKKQRKVV